MLDTITDYDSLFSSGATVDEKADLALDAVRALGFTSLIYDYSPVAFSPTGDLLTPSHLTLRDVPEDMRTLWCDHGYYQRDPVQSMASRMAAPFIWSYREDENPSALAGYMTDKHAPVARFLQDADLTHGITVPIHLGRGDLATFTAIRRGAGRGFEREAHSALAACSLAGQMFHDSLFPLLDDRERQCAHVSLSPRERECLRYSAEGLTAKEIAYRLNRSIPTVTLHINSAIRKLGARNRTHAVVLAHHYRLLDL
ncbi:helix-turn-helix transcriptional regulator [Rhodospirillum sp. A1_3_36]|uniref:helix-turn-helix transcriptional regulator n=1 Tax=Rhodospirillum sp. A1_3_36 TaxID=3391666 RepID=UPI0039A616F9